MHPRRKGWNRRILAVVLSLAATCAGCWETIEYNGPRTTAASQSKTPPEKQSSAESTKSVPPVAVLQERAELVSPEPPTSVPTEAANPQVAETTAPKRVDGLYSSETTPAAAPPAESSASALPPDNPASAATVGDRYATPNGAANPPVDGPPSAPSTPAATATAAPAAMTATRAAWLLGSRLSLATLAHDRGVAANNVPVWFADAKSAATFLGTTIDDLPEPAATNDTSPASRQAINYLLVNGQRVGRELSKQHGAEPSALFEIGLKSNLLLLIYTPGASAGDSIATAVSKAAPQAKLPAQLWQPLVDALKNKTSQADVRSAVRKMHGDIERYLAQPVEQRGK